MLTDEQREDRNAKQREYRKTPEYRAKHAKWTKEWQLRNPEKRRAYTLVWKAVKRGKLVRPDTCQECHKPTHPHAHHSDYKKRYDVIWLCPQCHAALHKKLRSEKKMSNQSTTKE